MIDITLANFRCFRDTNPLRLRIDSGITAILGLNNIGKSSILRSFYELRPLFDLIGSPQRWVSSDARTRHTLQFPPGVREPTELLSTRTSSDLQLDVSLPNAPPGIVNRVCVKLDSRDLAYSLKAFAGDKEVPQLDSPLLENNQLRSRQGNVRFDVGSMVDAGRLLMASAYFGPHRHMLGHVANHGYFDIPVGKAFLDRLHRAMTGPNRIQRAQLAGVIDDIRRLFGYDRLSIAVSEQLEDAVLTIGLDSFRTYELGHGVSQFLQTLATAALAKPTFLLIDEPEIGLHPSLQMDFVHALAKYTSHGVMFATHSYGLARTIADSLLTVMPDQDGYPTLSSFDSVDAPGDFLASLSYAGYLPPTTRHLLLVEGPHDWSVFRELLRLYELDPLVRCLHLGGRSTIHGSCEDQLRHIIELCPSCSVIIDSERCGPDTPPRREVADFAALCERLSIRCHVLQRRAIENYFSLPAIQSVYPHVSHTLGDYDLLKTHPQAWNKSQNWRIAAGLTRAELAPTDLGIRLCELATSLAPVLPAARAKATSGA